MKVSKNLQNARLKTSLEINEMPQLNYLFEYEKIQNLRPAKSPFILFGNKLVNRKSA